MSSFVSFMNFDFELSHIGDDIYIIKSLNKSFIMKKVLSSLFALCIFFAASASDINSPEGVVKYSVTAISESYLGATSDLDKGPWQKENSTSYVAIDWEKKVIEVSDEGPYRIVSVGKEQNDDKNRPSVCVVVDEGYQDDEMQIQFIIVVTEGKSVKEMKKGYLFQVFGEDVFGFELSR